MRNLKKFVPMNVDRPKVRSKRAGMSLITVMFFLGGISLVALSAIALSTMGNRMTYRTESKVVANTLAESAINDMYDRIRIQMNDDGDYPQTLDSTDLTDGPNGTGNTLGSYSARLLDVQVSDVAVNGKTEKQYAFTLEGTGVASNGVTSVVTARFTAISGRGSTTVDLSANPYGMTLFSPGAIQSNTTIDITSDKGLVTSDRRNSKFREAHLVANEGITWTTFKSQKRTITDNKFFEIEGQIIVPKSPSSTPFDLTVSTAGLGNPNGIVNYNTDAYTGTEWGLYNSNYRNLSPVLTAKKAPIDTLSSLATDVLKVTSVGGPDAFTVAAKKVAGPSKPWPFPSEETVSRWEGDWFARVHAGDSTQVCGDLCASDVTPEAKTGYLYVKTPMVIHGNLDVPYGYVLRVKPMSKSAENNILYVTGNITNLGGLYNLGATIVTNGTYSDSSKAEYKITESGSIFSESDTVARHASLVSLAENKNAITIHSTKSSDYGLIFAGRGGILVDSTGTTISGALISSPKTKFGGITIRPTDGGQVKIGYDTYATGPKEAFKQSADTKSTSISTCQGYLPSRITNWHSTR